MKKYAHNIIYYVIGVRLVFITIEIDPICTHIQNLSRGRKYFIFEQRMMYVKYFIIVIQIITFIHCIDGDHQSQTSTLKN